MTLFPYTTLFRSHPKEFVDSAMKPSARNRPSSDRVYLGTVIIPHVKGISEKFGCIGNRFQLRTIFKTKHTLHGTLMTTGPVRDVQQTKQCVQHLMRLWQKLHWRNYRPLEVRIKEHKYNLTQGLPEKSKLAQQAYEEDHRICWNEATVLQIEPNTTHKKYMESAHMSLLDHLISQPSVESPLHHSRSEETTAPSSVVRVETICFSCVGTTRNIASLQQ
jgi:hypothetical protein